MAHATRVPATPLAGRRILVTRPRDQAAGLISRLRELGAEPMEFPTIRIDPPADYGPLDRAIARLSDYRWVIFTSRNGVRAFFRRVEETGADAGPLRSARLAAIGPETAAALEQRGFRVDFAPGEFRAEALVEGFGRLGVAGARILLARAERARDVLPEGLRSLGAEVDVVAVYRTVPEAADPRPVMEMLEAKGLHALTFTSSSTVAHFARALPVESLRPHLDGVVVACIGPVTAQTAQRLGLRVDVVAREYTAAGLVEALVDAFTTGAGASRLPA